MQSKQHQLCAICEEPIPDDHVYFGDEATEYEGQPLCEICYYEDEPVATVYYGTNDEPYHISLTRNETDGDFWVTWHPTDPWRGYYEPESRKYAPGLL